MRSRRRFVKTKWILFGRGVGSAAGLVANDRAQPGRLSIAPVAIAVNRESPVVPIL